jgi:hypothetical protein
MLSPSEIRMARVDLAALLTAAESSVQFLE